MKQVMTFQQAALDPNRPSSIHPRQWMYAVQAQMAIQNELVDKTISRIASQTQNKKLKGQDCFQTIELGVDQLVSSIKIITRALNDSKVIDLKPEQRKIIDKVRDLVQTAISPYTVDIIQQLDKLQEEQ